ncbi:MAG: hypothetical protein HY726_09095 [Candidatus Rokubacteria bacterium]|nr:hypothetical protein [Candidatus Rokubacteria bacterium]
MPDQRGVAIPMTLLVLLLLSALTAGFATLSSNEPQIAANLKQETEALALAEAGIERVIWALNNPTTPDGLAFPLPATIPDPYTGATDLALGSGVYRVTVAAGATASEVAVTSEGRVPGWTAYRGRRTIAAVVTGLPNLNPPCAVCAKGGLTVGNKTIVDSRTSTCGSKRASYSTASTDIQGVENKTQYGLFAADADANTPNQATDYSENVPASTFDAFTLTPDQINLLKDLAKARGTYYRGAVTLSGSVPDGIVFVDTASGDPIGSPPNPLDFGSVAIEGNVGNAKGWILVMGDLSVRGEWLYSGLLYAANRVALYRAEGLGENNNSLSGAIIAGNVSASPDAMPFNTSLSTKTNIQYNCDSIRTAGSTVPAFFVKPGSWREVGG